MTSKIINKIMNYSNKMKYWKIHQGMKNSKMMVPISRHNIIKIFKQQILNSKFKIHQTNKILNNSKNEYFYTYCKIIINFI